ncbi:TolB family protein [Luteitalea pratensis]|nr:PD40 domain-containing protein [Luteitalea pratensis]
MDTRVLVVSLGRVVADQVRVDATEAHAVLQHVWQRMQASRDTHGATMPLPPLDALGITPFGDFELREAACAGPRRRRRPHELAQELAGLLLRLLSSAATEMDRVPRTCLDAARRASALGPSPDTLGPIVTPDALFTAIEAFRPRDPSVALSGLYARWIRTTDSAHAAPWDARVTTGPAPVNRRIAGDVKASAAIPSAAAVADPRIDVFRSPEHCSQDRVPTRTRRPVAALLALLCVMLLGGVIVRQWTTRQPRDAAADRAMADGNVLPIGDNAGGPVAAGEPSATEVEIAPPPARIRALGVPLRARRLLDAGMTGRPPYSPSFDPHHNAILFHAGLERSALLQASIGSDGAVDGISTIRQDGARNYHAQVSPDGRRLAYDSDADGTRGVYIANRDGSSPKHVSGTGYASVPAWSPDGQSVAFARAEPGRPRVWNVWTVHVATGALRRHTAHRVGQAWGASWFPDGRQVAYSIEDRLVVRDLENGVARVYRTPVAGRLVRTPAVSPDGQRIVFQVYRAGAWVLDLRTGASRRLLADASAQEFAWSPDGRRVVYDSVRGGEWGIWILEMSLAP